jgi:hypothetical protein
VSVCLVALTLLKRLEALEAQLHQDSSNSSGLYPVIRYDKKTPTLGGWGQAPRRCHWRPSPRKAPQ